MRVSSALPVCVADVLTLSPFAGTVLEPSKGGAIVPAVYIRTLRRAAELVGGSETLARRLKVTPSHLELWTRGLVSPPGDVFLMAADIITEHDLQQLAMKQAIPPENAQT